MKDPYNEYIERNGKHYRYDPDFDCYYRIQHEGPVSRWAWVFVTVVLAACCYYIEFHAK